MRTFTMNSLGVITQIKEKLPLDAYELADWLESAYDLWQAEECMPEAAVMLRMQADEIKALRSQLNEL